jgi:hypothetical protein
MDPACLLIEAIVVEICSLNILNKWIQLTGDGRAKRQSVPRSVKRPLS